MSDVGPQENLRENTVALLSAGEGLRSGCLLTISSNAAAIAIRRYFSKTDLVQAKQWCYIAEKLRMIHVW